MVRNVPQGIFHLSKWIWHAIFNSSTRSQFNSSFHIFVVLFSIWWYGLQVATLLVFGVPTVRMWMTWNRRLKWITKLSEKYIFQTCHIYVYSVVQDASCELRAATRELKIANYDMIWAYFIYILRHHLLFFTINQQPSYEVVIRCNATLFPLNYIFFSPTKYEYWIYQIMRFFTLNTFPWFSAFLIAFSVPIFIWSFYNFVSCFHFFSMLVYMHFDVMNTFCERCNFILHKIPAKISAESLE